MSRRFIHAVMGGLCVVAACASFTHAAEEAPQQSPMPTKPAQSDWVKSPEQDYCPIPQETQQVACATAPFKAEKQAYRHPETDLKKLIFRRQMGALV